MKMITKMSGMISKITLNAATFHSVEVKPSLINFFYGNNGTGKSTIARAIKANEGLTWQTGKSASDYSIHVYNQEFVTANFQDYSKLKGVFTIGEENIQIQADIDKKTAIHAEQDKLNGENRKKKEQKEIERNKLLSDFQERCWSVTKKLRDEFDDTQSGYKRKAQFTDKVMQTANPTEHDIKDLRALYETAFDTNARTYSEFALLGRVTKLQGSQGNDLLATSISSSSETEFSRFLKAINATDWVRQGYERFHDTPDGKCPYCQQELPKDFEEQLAACFDQQYQEAVNALQQFYYAYQSDMHGFIEVLKENLQDVYPKIDTKEYEAKAALLEKLVEANLQIITTKIKEPSSVVSLDNEGVKTLREELNALIAGFNKLIQKNNDIVGESTKKNQCIKKVWELIAFTLQRDISAYKASRKALDDEIATLTKIITDGEKETQTLRVEIVELNKRIISTLPTITSMNNLLRDSGFQGFYLREKKNAKNTYEVIRQDGSVAENLSEGERNFIAFLYFYHLVRGAHSNTDISKDKIVVIDDPVSSMDSSVLFIVSTLVREMIGVCSNNVEYREDKKEGQGDYIKQIFILTHNAYFHREITYNQTSRFRCVSFFVVKKASNNSSIIPCIRGSQKRPTEQENYNPVQNSYAALWREYREVDTTIPMMNVIRRILEYYFMQICGYDGMDIRKWVLEDHKESFIETSEEGLTDNTKLRLATIMLSYIRASSVGFSDGLNYVDDCSDIELYKTVFKMIFEALEQEQHYKLMMVEE
jgi:wobble nucleotide-excising tRNase